MKLPELDAAALLGLDITEDFLHTFRDVGLLWDEWREMTEDGKLESEESAGLWRRVHLSVRRLLGIAVQSDRIFGAEHDEN